MPTPLSSKVYSKRQAVAPWTGELETDLADNGDAIRFKNMWLNTVATFFDFARTPKVRESLIGRAENLLRFHAVNLTRNEYRHAKEISEAMESDREFTKNWATTKLQVA